MAIAFDASSDGGFVTGTSLTWSHTCTGSNLLLRVGTRGTSSSGAQNVTGVTYNSVALTKIAELTGDGGSQRALALWELKGPATGANTVAVSGSPSDVLVGCAASYTGVGATFDASNTAGATSATSLAVTVTPVADSCWVQGIFGHNVSGAATAGTGTTSRVSDSSFGVALMDNNAAISPAAATTLNANAPAIADVRWVAASIVPSGGGGGGSMMVCFPQILDGLGGGRQHGNRLQ